MLKKHARIILIFATAILIISLIASSTLFTFSKYAWKDRAQSFDIKTADFDISTDAAHKIIVYNPDVPTAVVQYTFNNFKSETPDKYSTKEIQYQIFIHYGDADDHVELDSENDDFDFTINNQPCPHDRSPVYTMAPNIKQEQIKGLRFIWKQGTEMTHSEFIFVKVKVIAPYEKTYTFKITILSKAKILIEPKNTTDPFGNGLTQLSFMTCASFGASLPTHKMKIRLEWNNYVDIDDTNDWVQAYINDPLNGGSIVNGGTGSANRYLCVYLEPSAFVKLDFYKTAPNESHGKITASVEITEADSPYYDTWDSTAYNETDGFYGWTKLPDNTIDIP